MQSDKTADALKEFFNELNGILEPVPAEELNKAKNYVALGFPGEFETTGDLARKLEELVAYNLPDDTFTNFVAAVSKVTHIAPADANGEIIGSPVVAPGVINYPVKQLGLCAGITSARYTTTTEVYPDSPRATPEQCNDAQAAAVRAAIDFALAG